MLQIKDIRKQYKTGDLVQEALDGVSLAFRDNEFVAILGPSGSGKTTLLNIVGGLDRYDSGDLVINGVSTKRYSDRDWDTYRNHSIGFVFQSYNLIAHQSVLANVELALTISGISKAERRRRATQALEKVGLGDQLHKRPSQMSGGQMQRVAIARALVNDPEILLADEPTGALDTATGIQVMELLKEVAQDRLVIMVTHNPELAQQYATRIVNLRDGKIISDSHPLDAADQPLRKADKGKKASMSFATALGLSFNNLLTKKGRTFMTSAAGSIGIIGIALILALSAGVNGYISDLQKSTMSSYPIAISSTALDMSAMMETQNSMMGQVIGEMMDDAEPEPGVHSTSDALLMMNQVVSNFVENDLTAFKAYLDDPQSEVAPYIGENGVVYTYDAYFDVYAADAEGVYHNTSRDLSSKKAASPMVDMMRSNMSTMSSAMASGGPAAMASMDPSDMMSMMMGGTASTGARNFAAMLPGTDGALISPIIKESYDLLHGRWPTAYNEVVLVLDRNNSLSTGVMCQLGLMPEEDYRDIIAAIDAGAENVEETTLSFSEVVGRQFKLVTFSDRYIQQEDGTFSDATASPEAMKAMLDAGLDLTITGIVRMNEDAATAITAAIGYPAALTDYVIDHTNASAVIQAQEATPETDVLTGRAFLESDEAVKQAAALQYLQGLGVSDKAAMYMALMYMGQSAAAMPADVPVATPGDLSALGLTPEQMAMAQQQGLTPEQLAAMAGGMPAAPQAVQAAALPTDESAMAAMLDQYLKGTPDEAFLLGVYDTYLGDASYEDNMAAFGKVSHDAPSAISIYCDSFEDKEAIADCITRYNQTVPEDRQITYTDYVAMMTSAITNMVDIISYVLIAFVAVSLVVSCIMISIITQISVLERTKEIGILRAIGASKGNISQVFNAETFIIGITSGAIGVGMSELLLIPINAIIHVLTGNTGVNAVLPWQAAAALVLISIVITVFSGLIPARNAAKKDPVVALRE